MSWPRLEQALPLAGEFLEQTTLSLSSSKLNLPGKAMLVCLCVSEGW